MFFITFYIFSLLLSFTDFKRFIVPNNVLISMFVMLLFTGWIEEKIYLSSFIVPIIILVFFIILLLLNPKMILGGGDIKYMMIIGFYLNWIFFPLFLVVTGILQTFALIYIQNIKHRKIAPMVPIMFLSTIIVEIVSLYNIYP